MLGEINAELLTKNLASQGIRLDDPELTLEKVAQGINLVMGEMVTEFLIDKLLQNLDGICIEPPLIKE
jgi:hypothetical protein